jgi:TonB family protein
MNIQARQIIFCVAILLFTTSSAIATTGNGAAPGSGQSGYPNSESGLKHLIQDSLAAAKANDQAKLSELTNSMVLPSPEEWFLKVFGPEWGGVYTKLYMQIQGHVAANLASTFSDVVAQNYSIGDVAQFKNSCDFSTDQDEYPMLAARLIPEPFSLVRFAKGNQLRTLRFVAYVDGGFRFLGLLRVPTDLYAGVGKTMGLPEAESPRAGPLVVATDVQMAKAIHQVQPIYPDAARELRRDGKVILHAIINDDGTVGDLRLMRGQCPFAKEAVAAVKQWRFSPTLVKGNPVKISCIFELNFQMRQ